MKQLIIYRITRKLSKKSLPAAGLLKKETCFSMTLLPPILRARQKRKYAKEDIQEIIEATECR